jgi:hypothetical protein
MVLLGLLMVFVVARVLVVVNRLQTGSSSSSSKRLLVLENNGRPGRCVSHTTQVDRGPGSRVPG